MRKRLLKFLFPELLMFEAMRKELALFRSRADELSAVEPKKETAPAQWINNDDPETNYRRSVPEWT